MIQHPECTKDEWYTASSGDQQLKNKLQRDSHAVTLQRDMTDILFLAGSSKYKFKSELWQLVLSDIEIIYVHFSKLLYILKTQKNFVLFFVLRRDTNLKSQIFRKLF